MVPSMSSMDVLDGKISVATKASTVKNNAIATAGIQARLRAFAIKPFLKYLTPLMTNVIVKIPRQRLITVNARPIKSCKK